MNIYNLKEKIKVISEIIFRIGGVVLFVLILIRFLIFIFSI